MNSRVNGYYENEEFKNSRYHKHEDLYKEISKSELNDYDIKSNATVIGDNKQNIDIEKIKKILDTKYNETEKRKSLRLEEKEEIKDEKETTKEYDINVILEKAKEKKPENYEEDRLKKLRDTQYDILNNLNVVDEEENEDVKRDTSKEEDLKNLIDTIAFNEKNNSDVDSALDILSDLKGSGNTEVLDGLKEEIEKTEEQELEDDEEEYVTKKNDITDTNMVNSFYTTSNVIKDEDLEDMDDFSKIESTNVFIKIIVAVIVIAIIIGVVLLVKTLFF